MSDRPGFMSRFTHWMWIVPVLVVVGLVLAVWPPVGIEELLDWGRRLADSPVFVACAVAAIALLFAFGLPGSVGLWLIAPFHPPLIATALLVAGSVAGALGAYFVGARLGGRWQPAGLARRVLMLLRRRADPAVQLALRILPGFPHSVINFAGGVLLLPRGVFLLSALVGLTIKWAVYAAAVHGLVEAVEAGGRLQASTLLPLLALSALLLLGAWARQRLARTADREARR